MDVSVTVVGSTTPEAQKLLTTEALQFVGKLHRAFNSIREDLLRRRESRQNDINKGIFPDFLDETKSIREDPTWKGPSPAPGLVDRRVEITGPTDRKMVVNALNSNVKTYMADFEDSNAPTWSNMINGQVNLYDAIRRNIDFTLNGKQYALRKDAELPTLIVRPRGLHMIESHVLVDGAPISASIFDFGIYFFHNAKELLSRGAGPYFYLPKLESHLEARLWNNIFNTSQDILGITRGTIRATVLIETILAAFEMDEIIFELRDHSAGLNCGRWDYIFSFIKKFRFHKNFLLPDRKAVTMNVPFMKAYVELLIKTCHKRGVHAMGGMAALIPIKNDAKANEVAMGGVRADKLREVTAGHDGTWVAHPALAQLALDIFNKHMPTPNQLFVEGTTANISSRDLLNTEVPGSVTKIGIRKNIEIALGYVEAWLRSVGCVPIDNLMEDAATAEVSRSQLWQWAKHGATTEDGLTVTAEYNHSVLREVAAELLKTAPRGNKFSEAAEYLSRQITGEEFSEFLTTALYDKLNVESLPRHNSRL